MLDIHLIRENKKQMETALLKKIDTVNLDEIIAVDDERKRLIVETDELKAKRNEVSSLIPKMKKEGRDVTGLLEEMKGVSDKIKTLDIRLSDTKLKMKSLLEVLPNIPDDDVLSGGKKNNEIIRVSGSKPDFPFKPKDHIELATSLKLIDYERGVKMGGNGFWLYRGDGAVLEWALLNYFIEEHLKDGYEFILPPHVLIYECGYTAGQFPKFEGDVFHLEPEEGKRFSQFLLPTSETALINYHRDEIIPEDELPKKYFAYTPCYRREAGSYRAQERGMIRGHQFNKVEMFQFTTPETSGDALEQLMTKAENLVRGLGLHYQVSKLAAADCSFSMAKTYDIEVWIPSMNEYKEVSSSSNARDYQARRGNIRFRRKSTGKNEFIHSLNASGLATSRLLPAIIEQFQKEDGTVLVPEVLKKWLKKDVLGK
ncbi:MAG: serine--tRNA ligase [Spirochaetales bacterium]|nr:serine--tRNA ligase [Spirochaetales bacterium]